MPVCEISARKVGRAVGRWVGEREVEARAQVGAVPSSDLDGDPSVSLIPSRAPAPVAQLVLPGVARSPLPGTKLTSRRMPSGFSNSTE